jgi:hypothetical protein
LRAKYAKVKPFPYSVEQTEEMQQNLSNTQKLIYFLQVQLIMYQVFLSKSLQDLWAMLNTQ